MHDIYVFSIKIGESASSGTQKIEARKQVGYHNNRVYIIPKLYDFLRLPHMTPVEINVNLVEHTVDIIWYSRLHRVKKVLNREELFAIMQGSVTSEVPENIDPQLTTKTKIDKTIETDACGMFLGFNFGRAESAFTAGNLYCMLGFVPSESFGELICSKTPYSLEKYDLEFSIRFGTLRVVDRFSNIGLAQFSMTELMAFIFDDQLATPKHTITHIADDHPNEEDTQLYARHLDNQQVKTGNAPQIVLPPLGE